MKHRVALALSLTLALGAGCWRTQDEGYRYSCAHQDDCAASDDLACTGVDVGRVDDAGSCPGAYRGIASQAQGADCFYRHCVLGGARECGDLVCSGREICVSIEGALLCADEAAVLSSDRVCASQGASFGEPCSGGGRCYLVFDTVNLELVGEAGQYRCIADSELRAQD